MKKILVILLLQMAIAFNVFAQGEGDRIVNPTWKLSSGALTPTVSTWTLTLPATTFSPSIVTPLIIGGADTISTLTYKTTTGVGKTGARHIFLVGTNGGTEAMTILNDGKVGIGTASPGYNLDVSGTGRISSRLGVGGAASANVMLHISGTVAPASDDAWGFLHSGTLEPGNGLTAFAFGANPTILAPSGETVNAAGLALYDVAKTGTGTIGNLYGLYIRAMSATATNKWGIYDATGAKAYISGNVGIKTISPLATFHNNGVAMFGAGTGASLTDSSLIINYSSGSPVVNWYGVDGDLWNLGINTSDAATFTGASGGYSFDNAITMSAGAFTGNAVTRGADAFITTATSDTVTISGAEIGDYYSITLTGTAAPLAADAIRLQKTATGFVLWRSASGTSALTYDWFRQK